MRLLSLFSGIGGLELGLERSGGFTVAGQCEIEPFARAVLAERWPGVWRHDDVRTLTPELVAANCGRIDAICGGFPCQDISTAGKGVGLDGERSGLWREYFRVVDALRPLWVIAENVPALRTRGADRVLGDLEGIGYSAQAVVVGADDIGAPHRRKRVFILARLADAERASLGGRGDAGDVRQAARGAQGEGVQRERDGRACGDGSGPLADGDERRREGVGWEPGDAGRDTDGRGGALGAFPPPPEIDLDAVAKALSSSATIEEARAVGDHAIRSRRGIFARWRRVLEADPGLAPATPVEHQVCRVAHGLPAGLGSRQRDRWARRWRKETLKAFGNAVCPAVAEVIGAGIVAFEAQKREEVCS